MSRTRSTEPGLRVLTGAKRGEAESPDDAVSREDIVAGLTVFAVLAAFIAIFVVASTFALSVQQRHRELALFRAIGSTPRQVRRMVAGEALLVSLLAFVVAAPIGVLVAHLERGLFMRAGMVPEGLHLVVGWLPFVGGLVAAIITTQFAAFASARRASRIRPTDALREATVQRRPVSLGQRARRTRPSSLAGVAVLVVFARGSGGGGESDAPAATMILMLAAALLGPLLALPFAWLLGLPLAAVSRGPGHARPREHARQPAPRRLGRDARDARHLSRLHDPVREIGAPAADDRADRRADDGRTTYCARKTHPDCRRTVAAAAADCPE